MNKITIPLFNDYLKMFFNKSTDGTVVMACIARNGFDNGCCSDSLIKMRTGLSHRCIQMAFSRLINQKIFIECQKIGKERWGKINFSNDFQQKYLSLLLPNPISHCNYFEGTIKKISKNQSKIFLEDDHKHQYIIFCLNNRSAAFYLPTGLKITFRGSLINCENDITTVWMDDKTLECYELKLTLREHSNE